MSYFSNLLTTTTSRYTSFRRTLLSSSSEDDSSVDDPESSHVSRVLRAYYTEKNRPFPAWLGTDPRTVAQPQKPQSSYVGSAQSSLRGHHSSNSGGNSAGGGNAGVGGLGDLWASDSNSGKTQEEPTSLRRGFAARPGMRGADGGGGGAQQQQAPQRQLPSQRAGSYQTQQQPNPYGTGTGLGSGPGRNMSPAPPSSAGSGTSVQERLKARLGGRSGATPSPPLRERGIGGAVYEGQQGGGSSSYDDRRPHVGAGSRWSDADDGGYGSGAGAGAAQQGYYDGGPARRRDGSGPAGYGKGPSGGGGSWQRPR